MGQNQIAFDALRAEGKVNGIWAFVDVAPSIADLAVEFISARGVRIIARYRCRDIITKHLSPEGEIATREFMRLVEEYQIDDLDAVRLCVELPGTIQTVEGAEVAWQVMTDEMFTTLHLPP